MSAYVQWGLLEITVKKVNLILMELVTFILFTLVIDCGCLGNPGNGTVSLSNTTYNSEARYSCNTGYTLTGENMRTCQNSGLWSGQGVLVSLHENVPFHVIKVFVK